MKLGLLFVISLAKVYAQKGARNILGRVSNTRKTLTFVACGNTMGNEAPPPPPMIIAKGKTSIWYIYMGVQWFGEHFLQQCGIAPPQLLILDSHNSQESLNHLTSAKANDIHCTG